MNDTDRTTPVIDEFDLSDLDLGELTVVSMLDSAALPETGGSYTSSSCCYVKTK
jgi:hypothetical protein